jgi:hypothetical protein
MGSIVRRIPGLGRLLQALGVNSVPAAGFFGEGWSIGTTLALYWVETVLVIVLLSARIVIHRRLTRKAGHWNVGVTTTTKRGGQTTTKHSRTTHLVSFLAVMIPFTAAHGLFLAMILFLALPQMTGSAAAPSLADLRLGVLGVGALLVVGLLIDLIGIRDRPFRWIERATERAQGRMLITHLTIIFGLFAVSAFGGPGGLVAVFVGLKTLMDLGGLRPEKEPSPDPPRWLAGLDRMGAKDGMTFTQHYRKSIEDERAKRAANELPLAADEAPA